MSIIKSQKINKTMKQQNNLINETKIIAINRHLFKEVLNQLNIVYFEKYILEKTKQDN